MKFWWSRKRQEPAPRYKSPQVAQIAEARRKRRAEFKRTGELPAYVFHGTENAYDNYGCRCEPCRAASAEYRHP